MKRLMYRNKNNEFFCGLWFLLTWYFEHSYEFFGCSLWGHSHKMSLKVGYLSRLLGYLSLLAI
jgi:hypothetical protein